MISFPQATTILKCYLKAYQKAYGINKLREFADGDIKIIAVGDYNNDIQMIETADIGVATANAQEEVKAISDIVLKSTNNDGIISEILDFIAKDSV